MALSASVGPKGAAPNKKEDVTLVQQLLNNVLMPAIGGQALRTKPAAVAAGAVTLGSIPPFDPLGVDGSIGAKTVAAIVWFQKNVMAMETPDGLINPGGATFLALQNPPAGLNVSALVDAAIGLPKTGSGAPLSEDDFARTAKDLGLEVAHIKAVAKVEGAGAGFIDDGRPLIRFEAHIFSRLTGHFYDDVFKDISARKRNDGLVQGGAAGRRREFERIGNAMALDRKAALQAASWGMFQLMGFNYQTSGFTSVDRMVDAMYQTEGTQLTAFASFIKMNGYVQYLKDRNWAAFAAHYNGADYGNYDVKLVNAYDSFAPKTK